MPNLRTSERHDSDKMLDFLPFAEFKANVIEGILDVLTILWQWIVSLWTGHEASLERDIATKWVRSILPNTCCDFLDSWKDGILLCSLMGSIIPGSCPHPERLDQTNSYNNVKKALDTFGKAFGYSKVVTVDEIITGSYESERKLISFLCELKSKVESQTKNKKDQLISSDTKYHPKVQPCFAKGTGLKVGFVGRLAKITIFCDCLAEMDIVVEVRAPSGLSCGERLTNRSPKRKNLIAKSSRKPHLSETGRSISHNEGWFKERLQSSINNSLKTSIALEYEILVDRINMGYIPVETGQHKVIILWRGKHVPGSPFLSKVEDVFQSFNEGNVVRLKSSIRQKSNEGIKDFDQQTRKPSVRFKDIKEDNGSKELGKVVKRKVLRYIVKLGDQEVAVEAENTEMLASALLKLDYQPERNPFSCRRNSWGFVGDVERKESLVRQFSSNLEENSETIRRSSIHIDCVTDAKYSFQCEKSPNTDNSKGLKTVTEGSDKGFCNVVESASSNESCNFNDDVCLYDIHGKQGNLLVPSQATENNCIPSSEALTYSIASFSIDSLIDSQLNEDCSKIEDESHMKKKDFRSNASFVSTKEYYALPVPDSDVSKIETFHERIKLQSAESDTKIDGDQIYEETDISSQVSKSEFLSLSSSLTNINELQQTVENINANVSSASENSHAMENEINCSKKNTELSCHHMKNLKMRKRGYLYSNKIPKKTKKQPTVFRMPISKRIFAKWGENPYKNGKFCFSNKCKSGCYCRTNKMCAKIKNTARYKVNLGKEYVSRYRRYSHYTKRRVTPYKLETFKHSKIKAYEVLESRSFNSTTLQKSVSANNKTDKVALASPYLNSSTNSAVVKKSRKAVNNTHNHLLHEISKFELQSSPNQDQITNEKSGLPISKFHFTFQNLNDRKSTELCLTKSVKDIVKDLERKSLILSHSEKFKESHMYSLSLNFPPLAANDDRANVFTRIRQWETTTSLPNTPYKSKEWKKQKPELEKLMTTSYVHKKTLFFENAYKKSTSLVDSPLAKFSLSEGSCLFSEKTRRRYMDDEDIGSNLEYLKTRSEDSIPPSCDDSSVLSESVGIARQVKQSSKKMGSVRPIVRRFSDPGLGNRKIETDKLFTSEEISRTNSLITVDTFPSSWLWSTSCNDDSGDEYIDDEIPDYAAMLLNDYPTNSDFLFESKKFHSRPKAHECAVFGVGIYYGYVAVKNRFQVLTKGAGKGTISVSLQGSSVHDVSNVSVTYLRRDIYDITYQVMEPGYYLISVKWSDVAVPGSPFVCKVTY